MSDERRYCPWCWKPIGTMADWEAPVSKRPPEVCWYELTKDEIPPPQNFADRWCMGLLDASDAEDYAERWRDGEGEGLSLADFLGLTHDEYRVWREHGLVAFEIVLTARPPLGHWQPSRPRSG
jgi:hypothetical protein